MTTNTTRTFNVPDISCDHCKNTIESEVGSLQGVDEVEVDVAAKTVRVSGEATDASIRHIIEDAGYEVATVPS